jgi:hypothetical protein
MGFADGSKEVTITGGAVSFYDKYQTTNVLAERVFGGDIKTITVSNDSTTDGVILSFNGAAYAGELNPGESITLNTKSRTGVYVRGVAGGGYVRIWGW